MNWKFVVGLVAAMAGLTGASAETFTPAPVLGNTILDFDTQSGNYSGWVINDVGSINAVRATIQIHRLGSDPKWAPSFNIILSNGDYRVTFKIFGLGGSSTLFMQVSRSEKGKPEDTQFLDTLEQNQSVDVAVDWNADGTVTVRAGNKTKTAVLGGPVKQLQFSGSTGEIEFNPLQIGQVTP